MNRKSLFINVLANIVSFIVGFGISFLLTRFIVQSLGKEAYGFIGLSNNFVSYITIITSALNAMASRFISIKLFEDDQVGAQRYFSSVIFSNVILAAILAIPMLIFTLFIDKAIHIPADLIEDVKILWIIISIDFLFSLCTNIYSVAIFVKNKLYLNSLRTIVAQLLKTAVLLVCFICFPLHVWYIALANTFATVYVFFYNIKYTRKFLPDIHIRINSFRFKAVKEILASGIWNSLNNLNAVLLQGLDLLIANLFINEAAMGLLAIIRTVPGYFSQLFGLFSPSFQPKMFKLYAEKNEVELAQYINRCNKLVICFISIPIAGFIVFCDVFFRLWLPSENSVLMRKLSILTMAAVFSDTYTGVLFSVYIVTNKLKTASLINFITGVINVVFVFLALKFTDYGIYAIAGVSSLVTMIKSLSFNPLYSARCLGTKWNTFYGNILRGTMSLIIIFLIASIIKSVWDIQTWGMLVIAALVTAGLGGVINMFILFNAEERLDFISIVRRRLHI